MERSRGDSARNVATLPVSSIRDLRNRGACKIEAPLIHVAVQLSPFRENLWEPGRKVQELCSSRVNKHIQMLMVLSDSRRFSESILLPCTERALARGRETALKKIAGLLRGFLARREHHRREGKIIEV